MRGKKICFQNRIRLLLALVFLPALVSADISAECARPEPEGEPGGAAQISEAIGADGTQTEAREVHLDIDTEHRYAYMDASYAQGYIPLVQKDTVRLVVPLVADGRLRGDRLTAELVMGENAPFVYANTRKEVRKETYLFEKSLDVYLFCCDIRLEKKRANGKYPVLVRAVGYSEAGAKAELSCRLYITVSDGADAGSFAGPSTEDPDIVLPPPDEPAAEPATEEPSTEPVTDESSAEEPSTEDPGAFSGGDFSGGGYSSYGGGSGGEQTEKIYRQPRLMLLPEGLPKGTLPAGQSMSFCLSMQNVNESEGIYNLKVTVKPAQEQLSFSVSSFYFGRVYPGETISLPTEVSAGANAAAGKSAVAVSYEYENEKGTSYSGAEEFSLDISQPVQAALEGFQIAGQVYSMETVESPVQIRNLGKTMIYNARAELSGEGLFATGTVFAGNLDAGASYDGTVRIYVGNKNMTSISDTGAETDDNAYGPASGALTLTYEDASGEKFVQVQEFSTVIRKPQMVELTVKEEETQTNQWWAASLVLIILFFLILLITLGVRLRKSKNALADLLAAGR